MHWNRIRGRSTVPLVVLLALLATLAPVSAQSADTILLDINVQGPGGVVLHQGPLAVADPILPNPLYEALASAAPVGDLAPIALEDAPDGLYVETEGGGAPVQLVGWSEGLEQHSIAPVEFAAENLHIRYDALPVQLETHMADPSGGLNLAGRIVSAVPTSSGIAGSSGSAPTDLLLADETPTLPIAFIAQEGAAVPAQPQLAGPVQTGPTTQAIDSFPARGDTTAPMVAVLALGVALFLAKLLLPLYHRFKKKTALDNPTRQKVYELLRDAPGSSAAVLGERSALHVTTVKYHLDVLRRLGMVGEQMVDGRRRFYSYENGDRAEMLERALLDEPAARAVFQQIVKAPGRPFIEVAKALGMRKEHVHYHVQKLSRYGLISDKWEGGRRLLFPATPPATPAVAENPTGATEVQG
jgi:predicted transcriptional regulator